MRGKYTYLEQEQVPAFCVELSRRTVTEFGNDSRQQTGTNVGRSTDSLIGAEVAGVGETVDNNVRRKWTSDTCTLAMDQK